MSPLASGTRLGPYVIDSALGAGGMGEVYKASDERLGRSVAIKILPAAYAADPERVARFDREARALGALNHPNIAGIHGLEQWGGATALVMEYVEGEDLAARTTRGAVPLDETIDIALQIAAALDAAHQRGLIHRDLKPANIRLRPDGTVKLLDFGLAKALDAGGGSAGLTVTAHATSPGAVLGTTAYMSPEQACGRPVDQRTDIWAFGCVLYEMLAGRRAFPGDHPSEVLARVLNHEPDPGAIPPSIPPAVRRLLRRCLQKDPAERLRHSGDACLELRDARAEVDEAAAPRVAEGSRRRWIAPALVGLAILAAAAFALRSRPAPAEMRVEIVTPPTASPLSFALSPDGATLAYVASSGTESRLWLRSLQSSARRELHGTEGAESPFWSPDNRSIAFFAEGRLRRVNVDGGSVQTLANAATGTDGTWGANNVILFASRGRAISRLHADDQAEPTEVPGLMEGSNFSPSFLPDGRRFLYYHRGSPEVRGVYLGALDGTEARRRIVDAETGAIYSPTGHLLFVLRGTLYAQAFDAHRGQALGEPFAVSDAVIGHPGEFQPAASVSRDGSIAYRGGVTAGRRQLTWFSRDGGELGTLGDASPTVASPSLSRDETSVLFYTAMGGNVDLWSIDTSRGALLRLTAHPADDVSGVWSPDGRRVVFSSTRSGVLELYVKSLADGREDLLLATDAFKVATDWSADGRHVLYTAEGAKRSLDVWAVPLDGDRAPFVVVESPDFAEQAAQFSPDGKWIAYQSDRSGRSEIYVRPFMRDGDDIPISTAGGSQARWHRDGREVFYVSRTGDLMAVPVRMDPDGAAPVIGTPVRLFAPPLGPGIKLGDARHEYMVTADGQRFLVTAATAPPETPISLILNWQAHRP